MREPLYQVHVENREGALLPLGPKMVKAACENFALAIKEQIAAGNEKLISNPHVVAVL